MSKESNGYLLVDPKLEVGSRAILDGDKEAPVIILQMGQIFARVRRDDFEWAVMLNRLESVE